MKNLTAAVCLATIVTFGSVGEVCAQSDGKMKPLIEIINEARAGNETPKGTLHLFSLLGIRCGGFFGAMAGLVGDKNLAKLSMNMAQVTALAENIGAQADLSDGLEVASKQVIKSKDRYRALMIDNNTLRGNYFRGDPLLDGDFIACKEVMPPMLNFLKKSGIPLFK